jgi:7-alpha-hydroxysteroid dehydrogenase
MNPFTLEGKVAIITGGGRGIGAGIARVFTEAGAAVALTARTLAQVEEVAEEIRAAGGRALPIQADLYDNSQLPAVIDKTLAEFGGIDVLVNNAGAGGSPPFMETRIEDMQAALQLMVLAPFELARLAAPSMLQRPGASIINMTSVGYYRHTRGNLAHHTAKGAMAQLTRLLAADLGPKIRVNAIAPAAVETPGLREVFDRHAAGMREMVAKNMRLRRMGTPEDIAYAALYLASPAAGWVTGTVLDIDGGRVDDLEERTPDL